MPADDLELFDTGSDKWNSLVNNVRSDFYHSAEYHRFIEGTSGTRACLAVYGNSERYMAWPYLVRQIGETGFCDGTSAYGYTGPVTNARHEDEGFSVEACETIMEHWTDQGLVSMFTCFHPILENSRLCNANPFLENWDGEAIVTLGRSVSIDLSIGSKDRFAAYKKRLRQDIRRSRSRGLEIQLDEKWENFEAFHKLYVASMDRMSADTRYLYSASDLRRLIDLLGDKCHLAIAKVGDHVVSALMFVVYNGIAQAHLTGSDARFNEYSPLKALLHDTAEMASRLGAKIFHLGAGRGGAEDSLFEFKVQFADQTHPFVIGRWVIDQARYQTLVSDHAASAHSSGGFFPAYRA